MIVLASKSIGGFFAAALLIAIIGCKTTAPLSGELRAEETIRPEDTFFPAADAALADIYTRLIVPNAQLSENDKSNLLAVLNACQAIQQAAKSGQGPTEKSYLRCEVLKGTAATLVGFPEVKARKSHELIRALNCATPGQETHCAPGTMFAKSAVAFIDTGIFVEFNTDLLKPIAADWHLNVPYNTASPDEFSIRDADNHGSRVLTAFKKAGVSADLNLNQDLQKNVYMINNANQGADLALPVMYDHVAQALKRLIDEGLHIVNFSGSSDVVIDPDLYEYPIESTGFKDLILNSRETFFVLAAGNHDRVVADNLEIAPYFLTEPKTDARRTKIRQAPMPIFPHSINDPATGAKPENMVIVSTYAQYKDESIALSNGFFNYGPRVDVIVPNVASTSMAAPVVAKALWAVYQTERKRTRTEPKRQDVWTQFKKLCDNPKLDRSELENKFKDDVILFGDWFWQNLQSLK